MILAELLIYIGVFYLTILTLIIVSTISYYLMRKTKEPGYRFRTMFHLGRPAVQFLVIFMVASIMVLSAKFFQVRTFEQVVASDHTVDICSLRARVGYGDTIVIKDQESIHRIISAFEETTFMPSFIESTSLAQSGVVGREITLEFLGMDSFDPVTISSRGVLYNNNTGQAYGFDKDYLFKIIESVVIGESTL